MSKSLRDDIKVTQSILNERNRDLQRSLRGRGRLTLEQEFMSEMASALGRAEAKILSAFDDLKVAQDELEQASGEARASAVERYDQAYASAERALWEMIVHREAIGLRDSSEVRDTWPIPKRVTTIK